MTIRHYQFLAALCIAMGITSCSSDDPLENPKAEYDEMRYIAVQIGAPVDALTRAEGDTGEEEGNPTGDETGTEGGNENSSTDFENGAVNESYINRLDFFFYDAAGNPTSTPLSMNETEISSNGTFGTPDPNPNGSNITRIYTSVVPVALTQGQNLPSQIICVVNGVESGVNEIKTLPLDQLINVERTYFSNQSCFVMTNSVYYGRDIVTGQEDQRLCATPVNANTQLFGTKEAAQKAITDKKTGSIVDIYVERIAAKVGLTLNKNKISPYILKDAAGTEVTLTFTPEYWAMNATDKSIYLTKRYGVEETSGTTTTINRLPSFSEINTALTGGGFHNWNDATNHRSYWGTSPSYFENKYPDVSDDVNDLVAASNAAAYQSRYYSYSELEESSNKGIASQAIKTTTGSFSPSYTGQQDGYAGQSANGFIYTKETTVAKLRINDVNNSNPAAAVASAVIVGKYSVSGATTESGTFYIDRNAGENGIYYGKEADAKKTLADRQAIVFEDNKGETASGASVFTIEHPKAEVRTKAQTKLAGRLVTLQIAELPKDRTLYYYNMKADGTGEYVAVTTANLVDVNTQLLSVGYMDKFATGLAFYSIPIRHLNWNDAFYKKKTWTEEVEIDGEKTTVVHEYNVGYYDWANMTTGSVGVVRNHLYNLTINSITGLGTALRDPKQPIVPAKEEANQYIAARLNILAWKVANTWSVDL